MNLSGDELAILLGGAKVELKLRRNELRNVAQCKKKRTEMCCKALILLAFPALLCYNKGMKKNDLTATSAAENQTEIAALKARISELEVLVKYYEEQFRISKHRQYGASSEKKRI